MLSSIKKLVPLPVRVKVRTYLVKRGQDRDKANLFGDLAPLVPSIEQMFDGPQSLSDRHDWNVSFLVFLPSKRHERATFAICAVKEA